MECSINTVAVSDNKPPSVDSTNRIAAVNHIWLKVAPWVEMLTIKTVVQAIFNAPSSLSRLMTIETSTSEMPTDHMRSCMKYIHSTPMTDPINVPSKRFLSS